MFFNFRKLNPNLLRLIYDFTGAVSSLFFIFLYVYFVGNDSLYQSLSFLLLPFVLIPLLFIFGMYGKLRFSSTFVKAIAIVLAIASDALFIYLLNGLKGASELFLWTIFTSQFLILPRVAFGISNKARGAIRTVVNFNGPVVVTGGAGYIGSHVVGILLEKGYTVRVLDKLMYGNESLKDFILNPKFELISGDVSDIAVLTKALNGASAVIHLAGLVGDPACAVDAEFTRHTNIVSTKLIKQVAHSLGINRFIFASSCSVYGVSDIEVSETDQLNPVSLYAKTKIDSENELLSDIPDDFIVTVLRFATVFGHSRRPRFDLVANLFAAQAISEGEITVIGPNQWRPFVHVEDLARAIILSLEAKSSVVRSQIFNVGDVKLNMTLLSLSKIIENCALKNHSKVIKVNIQEGNISDLRNYAVSFSKINNLLGFSAARMMEDGVGEIMEKITTNPLVSYREPIYSNLITTRAFSEKFHDPLQRTNLYSTLENL